MANRETKPKSQTQAELEAQINSLQAELEKVKKEEAAKQLAEQQALVEKKNAEMAERKAAVDQIQQKASEYLKLVSENKKIYAALQKQETDLYEQYHSLLDDFARKYKNYHLSYVIDGDNVEFKLEEARAKTFEELRKDQAANIQRFWATFFDI